jgi:hypothetical protein
MPEPGRPGAAWRARPFLPGLRVMPPPSPHRNHARPRHRWSAPAGAIADAAGGHIAGARRQVRGPREGYGAPGLQGRLSALPARPPTAPSRFSPERSAEGWPGGVVTGRRRTYAPPAGGTRRAPSLAPRGPLHPTGVPAAQSRARPRRTPGARPAPPADPRRTPGPPGARPQREARPEPGFLPWYPSGHSGGSEEQVHVSRRL